MEMFNECIHAIIDKEYVDALQYFVKPYPTPKWEEHKKYWLTYALNRNKKESVRKLLTLFPVDNRVSYRTHNDEDPCCKYNTPLHIAVINKNPEMVEMLLTEFNAYPLFKIEDKTPLDVANDINKDDEVNKKIQSLLENAILKTRKEEAIQQYDNGLYYLGRDNHEKASTLLQQACEYLQEALDARTKIYALDKVAEVPLEAIQNYEHGICEYRQKNYKQACELLQQAYILFLKKAQSTSGGTSGGTSGSESASASGSARAI